MKIEECAKKSGIMDFLDCFDNPTEDELLFDARITTFDYYNSFDTLIFNKKGYNSFYNFVDKLYLEDDKFECHLMYDVSGYNYWTLDMEESNYLFLTVKFKREVSESELEAIFDKILNEILFPLQTKWEWLIDNKNYIRKVVLPKDSAQGGVRHRREKWR